MSDADEKAGKGHARGSGYDRADEDWYVEPASAVHALFAAERFRGVLWDPACGCGTIPKAAVACRVPVSAIHASDIVDRGHGACGDFLAQDRPSFYVDADCIVTNPPYQLAERFALRAIDLALHKVAFLMRLAWLEGDGRYMRLFEKRQPSRVLVFRNRISCPPGGSDVKPSGGAVAYCWVIWNHDHRGPTQLDWIKA